MENWERIEGELRGNDGVGDGKFGGVEMKDRGGVKGRMGGIKGVKGNGEEVFVGV